MSFTSESNAQQPARKRASNARVTDSNKLSERAIRRNAERARFAAECEAELTVINALRTFAQVSKVDNKHKVHNTVPARTSAQVPAESMLSRSHKTLAPARVRNNDAHVVIYADMSDDTARAQIARQQRTDLEMSRAENTRRRLAGERRK